MAEVAEESTHVWSHKARIALFLAAMRQFAAALGELGVPVRYHRLETNPHATLAETLSADLRSIRPGRVAMTEPGDWRVRQSIEAVCRSTGIALDVAPDDRFLCSLDAFDSWAQGRKVLRLEHFYRWMRRSHDVLMDGKHPAGGEWNYDRANRRPFGKEGPGSPPEPAGFPPDRTTRRVLRLVQDRFPDHPGSLSRFDWPLTRDQAREALDAFIEQRLTAFGAYQDALWSGEPWLYHSRLAAALNLGLLRPLEVIRRAEDALLGGGAPIESVEGFVRQILGWREYVRGLYWHHMPGWLDWNALDAHGPLPDFYWTGQTDMACLADAIGQTLEYGYAHHIQRLMVTGLFALLLGVEPRQVHRWYLAVYVDAVEWVEVPNTLGMSQHADGGLMASKPYAASGRYIQRMSNYCRGCRYNPAQATGRDACPFTTLYWDFLIRHRDRFSRHPRTAQQWRNLERLNTGKRSAVARAANRLREAMA